MTPKEIEAANTYNREWKRRNTEYIKVYNKRYANENPERIKTQKKYFSQLKLDAFDAYGGPICIICGEIDVGILSIDHSFKDGKEHRQELFGDAKTRGGWRFYLWLRKNGYPQDLGLRVLCMSCNAKEGPYTPKGPRKTGLFRDYNWLYKRYVTDDKSLHEIGGECGVSYVTIYNQLVTFDIPRRDGPRKGLLLRRPHRIGLFRNYAWLYKRYVLDKKNTYEIGTECGVSFMTILNQLKAFNIPRRKR